MKAEIYTKDNCPHCVRAKFILDKHHVLYEEISAVEHREALIDRVTQASENPPRTVPQIFIDGVYVGGADQLEAWFARTGAE